jgi:hypothetical protein
MSFNWDVVMRMQGISEDTKEKDAPKRKKKG